MASASDCEFEHRSGAREKRFSRIRPGKIEKLAQPRLDGGKRMLLGGQAEQLRDLRTLAEHGIQHAREFVLAGVSCRAFERRPRRAFGRGRESAGACFLEGLARLLLGQHGETRRNVRLQAIAAQDALAKAMDRHDREPARRVDDGREQAAGQRDLVCFGRSRQDLGQQRL